MEGRILRELSGTNQEKILLKKENLSAGMYLLNAFDGNQKISNNKIIIQ